MRSTVKPWLRVLLTLALMACAHTSHAADDPADDETEEGAVAEADGAEGDSAEINLPYTGSIYIPLKPPFVVNYGGPGPLRYLKTDITVRLQDAAAANSVRHHMPYIRNNLVLLFSAQTEESVGSQEGKEALRQEALAEVRNVLRNEDQQEGVIDLYFNTLLVQK